MPIILDVLHEEAERLKEKQLAYKSQIENLPKGSIVYKSIRGNSYPYLMRREGQKVITQYIPEEKINEFEEKIKKRKYYQSLLKQINFDLKVAQNAIKHSFIKESFKIKIHHIGIKGKGKDK